MADTYECTPKIEGEELREYLKRDGFTGRTTFTGSVINCDNYVKDKGIGYCAVAEGRCSVKQQLTKETITDTVH